MLQYLRRVKNPKTLPRQRLSCVPSMFDSSEVKVLYPT